MTTIRTFTILLLGLTVFSCSQTQTTQDKIVIQDTISKTVAVKDTVLDKLTELLDKALTADTLEFNNEFETNQSFLFFKSGHIISKTEKMLLLSFVPPTQLTRLDFIHFKIINGIFPTALADLTLSRPNF